MTRHFLRDDDLTAPEQREILELALVFPFWLWGPLLGLAAWGYVMDRRDASVPDQFTRPETASSEPVVTRRS